MLLILALIFCIGIVIASVGSLRHCFYRADIEGILS